MNAPYDGDRGQGAGGAGSSGGPPVPQGGGRPGDPDPYLQHAYDHDPYRAQDLAAQDPVAEALYDRAAHPPPPPCVASRILDLGFRSADQRRSFRTASVR